MREWIDKLKTEKKDQILILLLAGVLLLVIAIPTDGTGKKVQESTTDGSIEVQQPTESTKVEILENRLQQILSQVEGIGKTEVMITLKSEGKKVVEKDLEHSEDKEENSQDGDTVNNGQISDRESTVYEKDAQGNEIPYVTEELEPEIEGVLVIAQGGGNSSVAAEITEAVMALFGVEAHKIKVMKME